MRGQTLPPGGLRAASCLRFSAVWLDAVCGGPRFSFGEPAGAGEKEGLPREGNRFSISFLREGARVPVNPAGAGKMRGQTLPPGGRTVCGSLLSAVFGRLAGCCMWRAAVFLWRTGRQRTRRKDLHARGIVLSFLFFGKAEVARKSLGCGEMRGQILPPGGRTVCASFLSAVFGRLVGRRLQRAAIFLWRAGWRGREGRTSARGESAFHFISSGRPKWPVNLAGAGELRGQILPPGGRTVCASFLSAVFGRLVGRRLQRAAIFLWGAGWHGARRKDFHARGIGFLFPFSGKGPKWPVNLADAGGMPPGISQVALGCAANPADAGVRGQILPPGGLRFMTASCLRFSAVWRDAVCGEPRFSFGRLAGTWREERTSARRESFFHFLSSGEEIHIL